MDIRTTLTLGRHLQRALAHLGSNFVHRGFVSNQLKIILKSMKFSIGWIETEHPVLFC